MRSKAQVTVSTHAIIVNHHSEADPEILMARLAYKDHRWQKWSFPGGFVDQGERLDIALQREVVEETGIQLLKWQQVDVIPMMELQIPHIGFIFLSKDWKGEAGCCSRELLETKWINKTNFARLVEEEKLAYTQMKDQVTCLDWHFSH